MKICIYGPGAIGGFVAASFASHGFDVSTIARGEALAAIRKDGLKFIRGQETTSHRILASDDPAAIGPVDVLFIAVKATGLGDVAQRIGPLVNRETLVVFAQNGLPWWYSIGLDPSLRTPPPFGRADLAKTFLSVLKPDQCAAAIIRSANTLIAPGVVENNSPASNHYIIGHIDDRTDSRIENLKNAFQQTGAKAPAPSVSIRYEIWRKLLANISSNPLSVMTGRANFETSASPFATEVWLALRHELMMLSAAYGFVLPDTDEKDHQRRLKDDHKPSMLLDYESGRPMEIDEILMSPLALARAAGVAMPKTEVVAALVTDLAIRRGLYSGAS